MNVRSWLRGDDIAPSNGNGHAGAAVVDRPRAELRALEFADWDTAAAVAQASLVADGSGSTSIPAVYRAVQLLTDLVASIPLGARDDATGRDKQTPPILLHPSPDEDYTTQVLLSEVMASLLLRGFAGVRLFGADLTGQVNSMRAIDPDELQVTWATDRVHRVYRYRDQTMVPGVNYLHVDLNRFPGQLTGVSPVSACRLALSQATAEGTFAHGLFADDATPSGLLKVAQKLGDDERKAMRAEWEAIHRGHHRVAVASGGAEFSPLTIHPIDAQFLESRQFSVKEVARMFGLSAFWLNEDPGGSLTYVTTESMYRLLVSSLLQPTFFARIEPALSPVLPDGTSVKFNPDALLTADTEARYRAYQAALTSGWVTVNEVRAKEGLSALPGGDTLGSATDDDEQTIQGGTPNV